MSEPAALPTGWRWATLKELLREPLCNGLSVKGSDAPPGVPALRLNAMSNSGFDYSVVRYLPLAWEAVADLTVEEGDFFVSRGNGSLSLVGRGTRAQRSLEPVIFPDTMIRVRLRDDVAATRWIPSIWAAPQVREQIEARVKTTAGIWKISQGELAGLRLSLPPQSEQERIVAEIEKQFTRLDAGVEALKRLQAHLRRYRAAVLKAACEGLLVPTEASLGSTYEPGAELVASAVRVRAGQASLTKRRSRTAEATGGHETPFPLPTGWSSAPLGQIADIQGGITKGQRRGPDEVVRAVPYLRVANVQRGYLDLSEMKTIEATEDEIAALRLAPGDILFNEGGDRDKLGRGWIWSGHIPECIHQNHVFRARPLVPGIDPKFVSWYGNSFGQRYFSEQGKQTTNLASINLTKLSAFPVRFRLPPSSGESLPRSRRD